jgi:hypothetical protein
MSEFQNLKTCKTCKEALPLTEFSRAPSNKDGKSNKCKKCTTEFTRNYSRTATGLASAIRGSQVVSSRKRSHPPPTYTKAELLDWMIKNGLDKLLKQWELSNYSKDLTPSVDRLDDFKGYSLDNIQLVTWAENRDKLYIQRKSCKRITKQNRFVQQFTLDGEFVAEYASISAAARATNIQRTNINACCTGRDWQAGGYKWAHKQM